MTKFERDKVYKTRDGREARVICVDAPGYFSIAGFIGEVETVERWSADGAWTYGVGYKGEPKHQDPRDLMLPKPEPVVEWGRSEDGVWFVPFHGGEDAARSNPYRVPGRLAKRVTEIVE